jgi:hypothetical protein
VDILKSNYRQRTHGIYTLWKLIGERISKAYFKINENVENGTEDG